MTPEEIGDIVDRAGDEMTVRADITRLVAEVQRLTAERDQLHAEVERLRMLQDRTGVWLDDGDTFVSPTEVETMRARVAELEVDLALASLRSGPLHSDNFRLILRKLVRQAVREAMDRYALDDWINIEADRIAKGLVP